MSGRKGIPNDPERRDKIIAAALEIITEDGVANVTHRAIASRAGVPLGSITYHFDGILDVVVEAFAHLSTTMFQRYSDTLSTAEHTGQPVEAVVDLVCGSSYGNSEDMAALFEMYIFSRRSSAVTSINREWMRKSRTALGRYFPADVARTLDSLIEGWSVNQFVEGVSPDREEVRRVVEAVAGAPGPTTTATQATPGEK
ncbi:TetR/AcrR family transcriptional regulator [Corynebacterium sp. AOP40-9SA-29]|uniref:TetR/AcrR family transcriptional regulator n=1 Tax=Corynebacterium sp. AOP40-9SA-29 TaxID=3457677 RepID=UPI004033E590